MRSLLDKALIRKLQPLLLALSVLTCLPLPACLFLSEIEKDDYSKSIIYYPFAGILLGLFLVFSTYIFVHVLTLPNLLSAALILAVWVLFTGGLHLDGWADCTDAYYAAHKHQADRILDILKEPHIGAMSAISLVLLLLIKFSLLVALLTVGDGLLTAALLLSPTASRLLAIFYMQTTPYVRPGGIASAMNVNKVKDSMYLIACLLMAGLLLFTGVGFFIPFFLCLLAWLYFWRRRWLKIIGGYTGDCIGALIEGAEVIALFLVLVLL